MEDYEEKQLKADIMRKTMFSMDTRARTEVTVMAELIELRDWKAKAMPFLYYAYAKIEKEDTISGTFPNDDITKTLTELLGGEDERND